MVYSNGYVVSVISNGKILPERKDHSVKIQLNSEYSIRLLNKTDKRCVAKIYIDDENVSGGGYVIDAQSSIEIERFNSENRKFKLVAADSDSAASEGKGPKNDGSNGLIKVEFFAEKSHNITYPVFNQPYKSPNKSPWKFPGSEIWMTNENGINNPTFNGTISSSWSGELSNRAETSLGFCDDTTRTRDIEGVTVAGDRSNQKFYKVHIDIEPIATIIYLKLIGQYEPVQARIEYCGNCGRKAEKGYNFCPTCGHRILNR